MTFQERVADTQIKVLRKTHKKIGLSENLGFVHFSRKKNLEALD